MDITTVFGTVVVGSSPTGCTSEARAPNEAPVELLWVGLENF